MNKGEHPTGGLTGGFTGGFTGLICCLYYILYIKGEQVNTLSTHIYARTRTRAHVCKQLQQGVHPFTFLQLFSMKTKI